MSFQIHAKVIKKVYSKDSFYIWSCIPMDGNREVQINRYGNFSLTGELGYLSENKEYDFVLEEGKASKYGMSYTVVDCPSIGMENLNNLTDAEKKAILMDCTSSEKIADNILSAYPDFINTVLTEGKEAIDTKNIKGVGEAYLSAYARILNDKYKYFAFIHSDDLKDYQLTLKESKWLLDNYSSEMVKEKFKNNPYAVLAELGRKFDKSDELILSIRPELKESDARTEGLILDVLDRNEEDGSTRLNGSLLFRVCKEDYNCPELLPKLKNVAEESPYIYYDEQSKDLSKMATYVAECNVNSFVKEKLANSSQLDIDWEKYGEELSDEQKQLLKYFCDYNFVLLTGSAGCGKTFSLKALINLIEDNGMTYKCLAPTGIASLRMSESINRPASTIHRQCMGSNAVINTDVLIVDECSMVDLQVFNMMLRTIDNPNIRIVLVGDYAQVLPIGVGEVFVDLINSNIVPRANLTKVFRYGDSGVLYVATNIRNGKSFNQTENAKWNGNECKVMNNYRFIQTDDDDILETTKREYMNLINKGIKKDNVIILSPFNIGNFGTYNLNNTIQVEVNPPKAGEMEWERKIGSKLITFRIGDRVINTKNDYEALTVEAYEEIEKSGGLLKADDVKALTTQVFNGERGVIESIDDKKMIVKFGEQLIVYDKLKMYNLLLAYSISTHKSQGSEADYVINIISPMHKRMLNRNILYVADTRSKIKQIDIGSLTAFNSALLVDGTTERNTWLKELLLSDVEPHPIDETKE